MEKYYMVFTWWVVQYTVTRSEQLADQDFRGHHMFMYQCRGRSWPPVPALASFPRHHVRNIGPCFRVPVRACLQCWKTAAGAKSSAVWVCRTVGVLGSLRADHMAKPAGEHCPDAANCSCIRVWSSLLMALLRVTFVSGVFDCAISHKLTHGHVILRQQSLNLHQRYSTAQAASSGLMQKLLYIYKS